MMKRRITYLVAAITLVTVGFSLFNFFNKQSGEKYIFSYIYNDTGSQLLKSILKPLEGGGTLLHYPHPTLI